MAPKQRGGGLVKGHTNEVRHHDGQAADEPDAGARANECPLSHLHTDDPHECTRTHTHTHAHRHRHTHTRTHALCNPLQNTRAHEPARTRSHARTLTHTKCRSLARSHACARAGTSRATEHTCADELLQLRQQLAAQGAELQQLRQSNAALVAAADATASRSRDASTRRKA